MKAEERKELETNVLADRVGKVVQKMKGGPSRRVVFWLVILAAVGVGVFMYFRSQKIKSTERQKGWLTLAYARNTLPGDRFRMLQATVQGHAKEKSGLAAQMDIAFLVLDEGLKSLRQDKVIQGLAGLANIEESLEELETRAKDEPMLRAELAYHRAVTREARAILDFVETGRTPKIMTRLDPQNKQGTILESAKELFEKVSNDYSDTPYGDMATKRLEKCYNKEEALHQLRLTYKRLAQDMKLEEQLLQAEIRIAIEKVDAD